MSCCAFTTVSAWPSRLFSTTAVWLTTLILVEDPVGKHLPLPAHLQAPVGEVIEVDILAAQLLGDSTAIQDELLAIVRQGQLLANVTLFAVTEDVAQPVRTNGQPAMQVVRLRGTNSELLVEALYKLCQEDVPSSHIADVVESQLLHQTVLKGTVDLT